MKRLRKSNAITLVALVITIIILLILAGVSLNLVAGSNGMINKAARISEEYKKQATKENLELKISALQVEIFYDEGRNLELNDIEFFVDSDSNYYDPEIEAITDAVNEATGKINKKVKLNGYEFFIDEQLNIIAINETQVEDNANQNNEKVSPKALYFSGNNHIRTNITQEELFSSNYTIALQVRISREEQQTVNHMGLMGDHTSSSGLSLQFVETSTQLALHTFGKSIFVNYEEYYDKWADIVIIGNGNQIQWYINNKLVGNVEANPVSYGYLLIGTSTPEHNRAMKGVLYSAKVWNQNLSYEEILKLDMKKMTTIQTENIVLETFFGDEKQTQEIGTLQNEQYRIIPRKEEYSKEFKLNGSTYLNTGTTQQEIYSDNHYTIAMRVKLKKEEQYTSMGLLGDHTSDDGMALQFAGSGQLGLVINNQTTMIDYEEYYNKWADIVVMCDGTKTQVYINKELKAEAELVAQPRVGRNLLIGTSYSPKNRAMIGNITTAKIWKTSLSQQEIQALDMQQKNTNIQKSSIVKEYILEEEIENLTGNNYTYETDYTV